MNCCPKVFPGLWTGGLFSRLRELNPNSEWKCAERGTVLLLDDDGVEEGGIRKLRCLGDYNLEQNTLLAMQPTSTYSYQSLFFCLLIPNFR